MFAFVLTRNRMVSDPTDADLARSIATGSAAEAEALLCRRYVPRIELYGLKHLKSRAAAQDLAQQVTMRVLEALRARRVEDAENVSSFIFGTCRHVSWEMRRSAGRERKIEEATAHLTTHVDPPLHSERDVLRLFHCLGGLPEREAMVLRMSFMEDRAAEEIAGRLELSAGNVRVIRYRALAKVATCMGLSDGEAE
jgi:RNA polymerase sigma-70 factor, ECF subfamily